MNDDIVKSGKKNFNGHSNGAHHEKKKKIFLQKSHHLGFSHFTGIDT